jgi:hypothetical protein
MPKIGLVDTVTGARVDPDTTYVASSEVGTGANQLVRLDEESKLPPVDASNLVNVPGGGLEYQYQTSAITAEASKGYLMAGTFTLTLPLNPTVGDQVGWKVLAGVITLGCNGQKIESDEADLVLDIVDAGGIFVFQGAEYGWVNVTEIGAGAGGMENPMTAVGDMIVGGVDGAPARLAKGAALQVLRMNADATAQEYVDPAGGGGGGGADILEVQVFL